MGTIIRPHQPILSVLILESGTRIITCDHTINRLRERMIKTTGENKHVQSF